MFYNILLSKPFAEKKRLGDAARRARSHRRRLHAQVHRGIRPAYPNVGIHGLPRRSAAGQENQTNWLTQVILPGVKDGMQAAGP